MQSNAENLPPFTVHVLPDWTPSSVNTLVARFDALLKIPRGHLLEYASMQLFLLDEREEVVGIFDLPVDLQDGSLAGPSWKIVRSGLVKIDETATHCYGVINHVSSAPVTRADATIPVLLRPITSQIDVAGEPHLWWRFYNHSEEPVSVDRVFKTTVLHLDNQTFTPRLDAYNGPAELPSRRGLSGLWSLDDFDPGARTGAHQFSLSILGETSESFVFEWKTQT
jgi:hypothetical protein